MIRHYINLSTFSLTFVITILLSCLLVDTNDKFENTKPEIVTAKIGHDKNSSNFSTSFNVSSDKKISTSEKTILQNIIKDNVNNDENKTKIHEKNTESKVSETPNPLAAEILMKSSLKQSQSLNDKLIQPESVDNSINTQNHSDKLNLSTNKSDKNEKGASETTDMKSSSTVAKILVTKEEEQLPVPPLLNWDYTVNDAYDDDELYSKTFIELYNIGVEAYLENNWRDCITFLETALHEFRVYRHGLINCRIQCLFEWERTTPFFETNLEQIQFFDLTTRRALCLGKCHNKLLRKQYLPPFYLQRTYRERFLSRKPYEYLQLCYYKDEEYEKAASATYTVLMHDPSNSMMLSNMRFYLSERKVDTSNIKDLEEQPYAQLFVDAIDAYNEEEFQKSTQFFEESLFQYILAEDECRAFCDGEFDHGNWYPDFVTAIANHYTFNLYCKENCTRELSNIKGEVYPNVIATHYEYLQLSYYKVNDIEKACRAIGSYLLFYPENEDMLANIKFYKEEHSVPDTYFKPRSEAKQYFDRQVYERKIFSNFIEEYAKISKAEKARKKPRKRSIDGGLIAEFSYGGEDAFGNKACFIKKTINLFKDSILQLE